jgi:hypothetical protein
MAEDIKLEAQKSEQQEEPQIIETKVRKAPDYEEITENSTKKCKLEDPSFEITTNCIFELHEQVLSIMPSNLWEDSLDPSLVDTQELLSMIENLTSPELSQNSPPLWYEFIYDPETANSFASLPIL